MSKLEELINKLCPNGVEFQPLKNKGLFKFYYGKGNRIPEDIGGIYDVYGANGIVSHINEYNCEDVTIIGHIGAVGMVNRCKGKCFVTYNGTIAEVVDKTKVNSQYLYYVLTTLDLPSYKKGSQPFLSVSDFDKISIPVPPLEVQCEIVRILDNFTLLSAELSAELSARQKQYNFYKDELIKNAKNVKKQKLSEIAEIYDGTHQTPKYTDSGIKFISVENISDIYHSNKYISKEDYDKYKVKPKINDVFMTRIGTIGKCSVCSRQVDLAYYVSLALIRPNSNVLNSYYLKYLIESIIGIKELRKRTLVNAVPIKINKEDIGRILLPIPPLEEQERIVNILEKFDKLCNDLSEGLPAEIEARKKQYEYYRDKLLTFKELKS
ncbi:restriction endonuclease subunit S [Campylobacter devanensis]|uniref:restriction endonuclease subunit S n=1 Tax=Campylobacter devanensis TaxID=3161138 RepID=UPI000A33894E|nr:restriction endonuclease subunit S [Campylobacter sp. P0187]